MSDRTCSIDGCSRAKWARGWCGTHYKRWRTTGTTDDPAPRKRARCTICGRAAKAKNMCGAHYRRALTRGSALAEQPLRPGRAVTDLEAECLGCNQVLPLSAFGIESRRPNGRNSRCKECRRAAARKFKAANPDYWAEWRKANVEAVRDAQNRRRAARLGLPREKIDRAEVFASDNFTCRLCGDPLAMGEAMPHPLSPTVDHIIPLSKGGHHVRSNVQSAHFLCNTAKGDRLAA